MRTLQLCAAAGALAWHQAAASSTLPPTTGPYHVGLQKHAVPFLNEADPVWPSNISTSFLVTIYYPTKQKPEAHDQERPYLDPATAALYEDLYNLTAGELSTITSPGLILDADPIDYSSSSLLPPTLFFGPGGGGPPSECYTTLLSDLASHGYTVLAMDHAYEQPFVRYPNGTGVYGLPILYPWTESMALAAQSARVQDAMALLDYLPTLEADTKVQLNQTHVGIFGGSLGGSAAAATLLAAQQQQHNTSSLDKQQSSFRAGINMDGTFFGPLADVGQPFLVLGQEGHGVPSKESLNDATWPAFASVQKTAYWRWVNLKGTLHHDFSDIGYWKELVPAIVERDGRVGPISGERLVEIWRAYMRAFFDLALMGRNTEDQHSLLDEGVDAEWPEKMWEGGGGSLT
ncbi:PAF acetylhydrolase family protein [Apiospora saccharicola]|uniref:1-alkyl-2-acetylglycerophosphocholine esterase n=1 Tax=Apiospora saccharicola TaxID=335842 RepID=A0ABR1URQ6_9PEZI